MRVGFRLPTSGRRVDANALLRQARALEAAGAASLWLSDHVVQPTVIRSRYPYAADGTAAWDPTGDYLEAVTVLAALAVATERVELGTAVLVVPQRAPVLLAKQLATVSALAGGRLALGVGAGWLAEEFAALGADFASRGRLLDEGIAVLRQAWTGTLPPRSGLQATWTDELAVRPVPVVPIPILVGGMGPAAMRRVARAGNGWVAQVRADGEGLAALADGVRALGAALTEAGRARDDVRIVVRCSGSASPSVVAALARGMAALGAGDVILDAPADADDAGERLAAIAAALADEGPAG